MTYLFVLNADTVNMPQAEPQDWLLQGLHCRTQNSL